MEEKNYDILSRSFDSMILERNLWRRACHILAEERGFDSEVLVLEAYKSALAEHKKESSSD